MTDNIKTANHPSISLCMIVKDEADWVAQCIESVQGLVNEIIVVDTGSKDKTVKIAKNRGAKIFKFDWVNDFAAARNFSLEKASGDWILVLDADETIDISDFDKIRELIKDRSNCYQLTQRHYTNDPRLSNYIPCKKEYPHWEKNYAGYFESSLVRLFPRDPEVIYQGKVHELVEYGIKDKPQFKIVKPGILIHHYGHTPEVAAKKDKRKLYSGLGESKLEDSENAWKNYFELGVEYNVGGKLKESEEALLKSTKLNPYYLDTWVNLGYVQCELAKYDDAIRSLKNALTLNWRSSQAFCNLGVVYLRQSNFKLAEKCFTNAVLLEPHYVNAFCNLGKALAYMNRFSEAVHIYNRALELMPNCPAALEDLKVIYSTVKPRQSTNALQLK